MSIYSENRYVSMDLDLVNHHFAKRHEIRKAMHAIGFREEGRHFTHPETDFFVEFPAGPLAVGEEPVREIDEIELDTGILRLISATDCVKDRLAAYYHWNDAQCLEQAVLVAQAREIDLDEVERWSKVTPSGSVGRRCLEPTPTSCVWDSTAFRSGSKRSVRTAAPRSSAARASM